MTARLVNGSSSKSGRVEVFHRGNWGTVCGNGWDMRDASVACRMLGYPGALRAYPGGRFGPGQGRVRLGDVQCKGYENNLALCSHKDYSDCTHSIDAGVVCRSASAAVPQPRIPCKYPYVYVCFLLH